MKDDAQKLITTYNWMIKIEQELFLAEKKQTTEYCKLLRSKMEDIKKENELEFEIPGNILLRTQLFIVQYILFYFFFIFFYS